MRKDYSFEDFLYDVWADSINCTENACLDDDMPDAFDSQYENLDEDDLVMYVDFYGKKMFAKGQADALVKMEERLNKI